MHEGTRLGDITLCVICGFAIQLRRVNLEVGEHDIWEHFRVPITLHPVAPKRGLWDYEEVCPGCAQRICVCLPPAAEYFAAGFAASGYTLSALPPYYTDQRGERHYYGANTARRKA